MRVISQDGTMDIPYEDVIIQRYSGCIYFFNKNLAEDEDSASDIRIASYSTEEKAKKAIELMRKEYSEYEVLKAIMPGCADRFIKGYSINPDNDVIKELDSFNTFRFPADNEI